MDREPAILSQLVRRAMLISRSMESAGMFDLAIVGGGINGTGIARDAAGRGLRVLLVEQNDLASGTSSASDYSSMTTSVGGKAFRRPAPSTWQMTRAARPSGSVTSVASNIRIALPT